MPSHFKTHLLLSYKYFALTYLFWIVFLINILDISTLTLTSLHAYEKESQEISILNKNQKKDIHLAQYEDSGDTYDPFADYSEFDNATEEEADINFFKHGRLLSIGGIVGGRMFTQTLFQEASPAFIGGGFISFFFNLRFAIQVNYLLGVHPFRLPNIDNLSLTTTAQMSLMQLGFDMKYYLNTQNVTQGLAFINPYLIIGGDRFSQSIRLSGDEDVLRPENAFYGLHGGLGVEFPFTLNKVFFGFEVQYQFVQFPRIALDPNGIAFAPNRGDIIKGIGFIGINF